MADERAGSPVEAGTSLEEDVALLEEEDGSKVLDELEEAVDKEGALDEEDLLKGGDPDVVALAEADDLLEGTEGEQFEVLWLELLTRTRTVYMLIAHTVS